MDLNWVRITGYKRFEKGTLNTSGKIIAITGPNEAGKSSILEALMHLNNNIRFQPGVLNRSKKSALEDNDIIIEAAFLLNNHDREALSEIHEGNKVRWLKIKQQVDGKRLYEVSPSLSKNPLPHTKLSESLQSILGEQNRIFPDSQKAVEPLREQAYNLLESLQDSEKGNSLNHATKLKSMLDSEEISQKHNEIEMLLDSINEFIG